MRAHLPVSIAIFDWSGNVFRLARLGIVSLCAVCVCVVVLSRNWNVSPRRGHCNFHRYDLTIEREAGPVSCPESSNRFRPIGRGTCSHRSYTFVSLVFFFFFFFPPFYPDPDSFRSLLILPNSSTVDRLVIACLHSESWRFSSFLTASTRVNFTFYSSPRIWPFYSKDE